MNPLTPAIAGWAEAAQKKWQIPSSLNLSAAMVESGLGHATPPGTNNWHGIKSAHGVKASTGEQTPAGLKYTIVAGFMVFKTPADSFMYYGELLGTFKPYRAMVTRFLASPRAPVDVKALSKSLTGVYATAINYGSALIAMQEKYNLYQYDKEMPMTVPQPPDMPAVPVATEPLKIDIGSWLTQLEDDIFPALKAIGTPAAEAAITAFAGPLAGLVELVIGPTVINGAIDTVQAVVTKATGDIPQATLPDNAITEGVVNFLHAVEPATVKWLGDLLPSMVHSLVKAKA